MSKKMMNFKTKGMNRDLSVSAFSPDFAFENVNLRLSTNDGNTLLSWVNERGPKGLYVQIQLEPWGSVHKYRDHIIGTPIGMSVLNEWLVVFSTNTGDARPDYIYKLRFSKERNQGGDYYMEGVQLYNGVLGFDVNRPLETLASYEADKIQKVYWTDGKNQPRMINIAVDNDKLELWNTAYQHDFFCFVPALGLQETFRVEKNVSSSGLFAPGVIQYCYCYFNEYGQQSNIVGVSPLYYLTRSDRGASPEEKVNNSFFITIEDPDEHFDYVRLYSIQRTSLNLEPIVKLLGDLPVKDAEVRSPYTYKYLTYTDNGTTGSSVDPMELLYVGGKEIAALTMADKDNTLFLGNIQQLRSDVSDVQDYYKNHPSAANIVFERDNTKEIPLANDEKSVYPYYNTLKYNQEEITTFKGGETYRFGFQLQKNTGEWTEPIFLEDKMNTLYPEATSNSVQLAYATTSLDLRAVFNSIPGFDGSVYKKARPLIVYPTIGDRTVLCQGVINPTVFNVLDRKDNSPFAQASWYFRPYTPDAGEGGIKIEGADYIDSYNVESLEGYTIDDASATSLNNDNYFEGKCTKVFVVVGLVTDSNIELIRNRGYLTVDKVDKEVNINDNGTTFDGKDSSEYGIKYYIDGIIALPKLEEETYDDTYKRYAFIGMEAFPVEYNGTEKDPVEENGGPQPTIETRVEKRRSLYYNEFKKTSAATSSVGDSFDLYNSIRKDEKNEYYYYNDGREGDYTFGFFTHNSYDASGKKFHKVTFKNLADTSDYYDDTLEGDHNGDIIPFKHYTSLFTSDLALTYKYRLKACRQIEIQNSTKVYDSPFSASVLTDYDAVKNNSQFFVDQSIVTLNSPDIELDTEVQSFSMEGLRLRVVGAIPITASVSSHFISTSSPMLPLTKSGNGFGVGEKDINMLHYNIDSKAGKHLVSDYMWNDAYIVGEQQGKKDEELYIIETAKNFLVYPWQRTGSLNNDTREQSEASSYLKVKKESNLLYSNYTVYTGFGSQNNQLTYTCDYDTSSQIHLQENAHIINYRLDKQNSSSTNVNYYPNIDKILYNENGYFIISEMGEADFVNSKFESGKITIFSDGKIKTPVSMKYLSNSHAVIALKAEGDDNIPVMPYGFISDTSVEPGAGVRPAAPEGEEGQEDEQGVSRPTDGSSMPDGMSGGEITSGGIYVGKIGISSGKPYWFDKDSSDRLSFTQEYIDLRGSHIRDFLWIGELYKTVENRFGGDSTSALRSNKWQVAGDAVDISTNDYTTLFWTVGDTYYQRYDCLKTYAFTPEDTNQIVEILSFMCENRVNTDGRYDKNRGQTKNIDMSPQNFGGSAHWNPVYSQQDNFFSYRKLTGDGKESYTYPNQIWYSKSKTSGADIDLWTNVTLTSTLELDGDKGELNALRRFNNQLIAFQDTGISQVMYNENTMLSTTKGVPVEIGNSEKVTGKTYLSDTVGCSNSHSIVTTPSGIYFMDSNDKSIYKYNGQLSNLSVQQGFNSWCKQHIPSGDINWTPLGFDNYVAYYDKQNQDVLFIDNDIALAYSEKLGVFTSFYNYGGAPYFCTLQDKGLWLSKAKGGSVSTSYRFWQHNAGAYCNFFGMKYPFSMTLVGNPEPQLDKIFTNIEFRASIAGDGEQNQSAGKFTPYLPFDSLEVWNEYQHGKTMLHNFWGHRGMVHHALDKDSALKRKFRIWRCDIPRDNMDVDADAEAALGISRFISRPSDRMRNLWVYLKLEKEAADVEVLNDELRKTEIHDIMMTYFI